VVVETFRVEEVVSVVETPNWQLEPLLTDCTKAKIVGVADAIALDKVTTTPE
jgi:hypothetical protein